MTHRRKGARPPQTSTQNSYLALTYQPDSDSSRGSTSSEDRRPNIQRRLPDSDSSSDVPLEDVTSIIADLQANIEELKIALAQSKLALAQSELKLSDLISQQAAKAATHREAIVTIDGAIAIFAKDIQALQATAKDTSAQFSAFKAELSAFKAETASQISSLKTQSTATPLQKTYASVASSGSRPVQPPGPPRHVATGSAHCAFVVAGSLSDMAPIMGLRGNDLSNGLAALIRRRLSLPPGSIHIVDAYPLGRVLPTDPPPSKRHRFFFRVERLADAELVVRHRHTLKGSDLVIFDELSSAERISHQALWPSFTAARRLGLKAQFKRARLFITSKSSTYQVVL